MLEPLEVAVRLEREAGKLDAEGGGLGLDAVRAADHRRVDLLARALYERGHQLALAPDEEGAGGPQLERQRGVEHVGARQAEVYPATGHARRLRQDIDERGHVVI